MKLRASISLITALLSLAVTGCKQSVINPTGAWEVTVSSTNTQARPTAHTLKLNLNGSTLTGTLSYNTGPTVNGKAPVSERPITEGKFQGKEVSFNFTHPPAAGNGPNATYSYQGTISGDTIKGTFTMEWMGETRTKGWEAKRLKD